MNHLFILINRQEYIIQLKQIISSLEIEYRSHRNQYSSVIIIVILQTTYSDISLLSGKYNNNGV